MGVTHRDSMAVEDTHNKNLIPTSGKPGALVNAGSTSTGNKFVKAIDQKARSYFKTLQRSFSSSMVERLEDPASMTIEFLRERLQIQRAAYKLEKERAEQLEKKVMELEERLKSEIQQQKEECCDIVIPLLHDRDKDGPLTPQDCNEELSKEALSEIQQRKKECCDIVIPSLHDRDKDGPLTPQDCNEELSKEALSEISSQLRDATYYSSPVVNRCCKANRGERDLVCPSCHYLLWERLKSSSDQSLCQYKNSTEQEHDGYILHQQHQKVTIKTESAADMEKKNALRQDSNMEPSNKVVNHDKETVSKCNCVPIEGKTHFKQASEGLRPIFHPIDCNPLNEDASKKMETFKKCNCIPSVGKSCRKHRSDRLVENFQRLSMDHFTCRTMKDHSRGYYSSLQDDFSERTEVLSKASPNMSPELCNSKGIQDDLKPTNQMYSEESKAMKAEMVQYVSSAQRVGSLNWVRCEEFYTLLDIVTHNPYPSLDIQMGHKVRMQGRRMSLDGGLERVQQVVKILNAAK